MSKNEKKNWIVVRVSNPLLCSTSNRHECGICLTDFCLVDEDPIVESVAILNDMTSEKAWKAAWDIIKDTILKMDTPADGWEVHPTIGGTSGALIECSKYNHELEESHTIYCYSYHLLPTDEPYFVK